MDILRFKRVQLLQGMETSFQDLCDWILLVVKLQEDVSLSLINHFAEQLGPNTQNAVCTILTSLQAGGFVDPIPLYVELRKLQPTLFTGNAYDGRYLTALVDDFIEKDASIEPVPIYQAIQTDLTPTIRGMLAEWLLQVSIYSVQSLRAETYFLGMTILDQYLALHQVSRSSFLLFGCAALYLACKFEELYLHNFLRFLVSQAAGSFTCEKVLQTEKIIATALDFHLCPNTLTHMTSALVAEQDPPASKEQMDLLRYIISSVTIHTYYGQYHPSQIAATCVFISRVMCDVSTGDPGPQVRRLIQSVMAGIAKNYVSSQVGEITFSLFAEKRFSEVSKLFCNPNSAAMKYLRSL
ncbi:mitotic cyclin [Strigomonas culicis]|nr:mitotic cyclin [Strigomonas culicis]|eukprot:EPY26956.1 mitotic cyclin [Strigomonas culicis]